MVDRQAIAAVTMHPAWSGAAAPELRRALAVQLIAFGGVITEADAQGEPLTLSIDATARSLLRRAGLSIRNTRLVTSNEEAMVANRARIRTNRRWLLATRQSLRAREEQGRARMSEPSR